MLVQKVTPGNRTEAASDQAEVLSYQVTHREERILGEEAWAIKESR